MSCFLVSYKNKQWCMIDYLVWTIETSSIFLEESFYSQGLFLHKGILKKVENVTNCMQLRVKFQIWVFMFILMYLHIFAYFAKPLKWLMYRLLYSCRLHFRDSETFSWSLALVQVDLIFYFCVPHIFIFFIELVSDQTIIGRPPAVPLRTPCWRPLR